MLFVPTKIPCAPEKSTFPVKYFHPPNTEFPDSTPVDASPFADIWVWRDPDIELNVFSKLSICLN